MGDVRGRRVGGDIRDGDGPDERDGVRVPRARKDRRRRGCSVDTIGASGATGAGADIGRGRSGQWASGGVVGRSGRRRQHGDQ